MVTLRANHGDASEGGVVFSTTTTTTTTITYVREDADPASSWEDGGPWMITKVALKVSGFVLAGLLLVLAFEYLRRKRYLRAYARWEEAEREREIQRAAYEEKQRAKKVHDKLKLVAWKKPTKAANLDETSRTDSSFSVSSTDISSHSDTEDEEVDLEAQQPAEPSDNTEDNKAEPSNEENKNTCGDNSNDDEEDDCYICLTAFEANQMVAVSCNPDCKHVFHHECVQSWLVKHDGCPVCRRPYLDEPTEEEEKKNESNDNETDDNSSASTTANESDDNSASVTMTA